MAALTACYDPHPKDGKVVSYPMAANTTIYKGGLENISGGYAVPAVDAANESFARVAHETKANQTTTPLPSRGFFQCTYCFAALRDFPFVLSPRGLVPN